MLLLALMVLVSAVGLGLTGRPPVVAVGDAPSYLDAAYHLAHQGTLNETQTAAAAPPAITREPGYAAFLSVLMRIDPAFGQFRPECLTGAARCDPAIYRWVSWGNLLLIQGTGVLLFCLAALVTRSNVAGLLAAAYGLFNVALNKVWWDPMSDRLGLFLLTLAMLAMASAWRRNGALRWAIAGLCLAALTLTKVVFFYYCLPAALVAAGLAVALRPQRDIILRAALPLFLVYATCIGAWVWRNHHVSGEIRLTDARSGIVLSTRQVLDGMTPTQYAAAFVYWTKGPGVGLAKKLFPAAVLAPFDLDAPGGFFDEGQNGYNRRVTALMQTNGIALMDATRMIDRQVMIAILTHPLAYAATTLPVLYRGIWIDEFALLGIPVLIWMTVRSVRRRQWLLATLLSTGIFNHLVHALVTLNIPRYQITALPATALAMAAALTAWRARGRSPQDVARLD